MKVLYCRVSSLDQKTDRQKIKEKDYKLILEDKCSGAIPFFEREQGKKILSLTDKGIISSIDVLEIDRLGRDLRDILNTIYFFSEKKIPVNFLKQGIRTLDENGEENAISKMMISILGTIAEMFRKQSKENQKEGIEIAKSRGVYKGRLEGSKEDISMFLNKEKNKKALELLKKGYKQTEIVAITKLNKNTITKIKRLGFVN